MKILKRTFKGFLEKIFRERTLKLIYFDILRFKTRLKHRNQNVAPFVSKLHLGCGYRKVKGWLNVDLEGSEYNVDLACGRLPWKDESFDYVVCQHLIDDLEIENELKPLLTELKRILKENGHIWLSTPDMEKVCREYLKDKCATLLENRQKRFPSYSLPHGYPCSQFLNDQFFEWGANMNLFDFELLTFVIKQAGFSQCIRVTEKDLLSSFPEFTERNDDDHTLYVKVMK